jgi:hypothetical protein
MNPPAKITELLGFIDGVICAGCRCHRRFTIFVALFISSAGRNFKILSAKKEAQEAFDAKIN